MYYVFDGDGEVVDGPFPTEDDGINRQLELCKRYVEHGDPEDMPKYRTRPQWVLTENDDRMIEWRDLLRDVGILLEYDGSREARAWDEIHVSLTDYRPERGEDGYAAFITGESFGSEVRALGYALSLACADLADLHGGDSE